MLDTSKMLSMTALYQNPARQSFSLSYFVSLYIKHDNYPNSNYSIQILPSQIVNRVFEYIPNACTVPSDWRLSISKCIIKYCLFVFCISCIYHCITCFQTTRRLKKVLTLLCLWLQEVLGAKANTVGGGGNESPAMRSDLMKWCYCIISNVLFRFLVGEK